MCYDVSFVQPTDKSLGFKKGAVVSNSGSTKVLSFVLLLYNMHVYICKLYNI